MPEVDKLPVEVGGDVVQEMTDRPRQNQILSGHDRPDNHMSPLQPKLNWPDVFFRRVGHIWTVSRHRMSGK